MALADMRKRRAAGRMHRSQPWAMRGSPVTRYRWAGKGASPHRVGLVRSPHAGFGRGTEVQCRHLPAQRPVCDRVHKLPSRHLPHQLGRRPVHGTERCRSCSGRLAGSVSWLGATHRLVRRASSPPCWGPLPTHARPVLNMARRPRRRGPVSIVGRLACRPAPPAPTPALPAMRHKTVWFVGLPRHGLGQDCRSRRALAQPCEAGKYLNGVGTSRTDCVLCSGLFATELPPLRMVHSFPDLRVCLFCLLSRQIQHRVGCGGGIRLPQLRRRLIQQRRGCQRCRRLPSLSRCCARALRAGPARLPLMSNPRVCRRHLVAAGLHIGAGLHPLCGRHLSGLLGQRAFRLPKLPGRLLLNRGRSGLPTLRRRHHQRAARRKLHALPARHGQQPGTHSVHAMRNKHLRRGGAAEPVQSLRLVCQGQIPVAVRRQYCRHLRGECAASGPSRLCLGCDFLILCAPCLNLDGGRIARRSNSSPTRCL